MGGRHLDYPERQQIERLWRDGKRVPEIAAALNRPESTIHRELQRGHTGEYELGWQMLYSADVGQTNLRKNLKRRGPRTHGEAH